MQSKMMIAGDLLRSDLHLMCDRFTQFVPKDFKYKTKCYNINHNLTIIYENMLSISTYIQFKQRITSYVSDYITKNQNTSLSKLISIVYKEFGKVENLSKSDIEDFIKEMIKKQEICIQPQISNQEIVNSVEKKAILIFIDKNPGISYEELMRQFNLTKVQLLWHLKVLEYFKLIESVNIKKNTVFFTKNQNNTRSN